MLDVILLSYKQLLLLMLISDNTQPLITTFVCLPQQTLLYSVASSPTNQIVFIKPLARITERAL